MARRGTVGPPAAPARRDLRTKRERPTFSGMTALAAPHLLTRGHHKTRVTGALPVLGDEGLAPARVHEICGPARIALALAIAGATVGPVIWILRDRGGERPNPDGAAEWMDPGRLVFVQPKRVDEALWTMEETLRAGVVPLVVADLAEPPALTPVRRLQLAAEAGAGGLAAQAAGGLRPTGLILTPEDGGAPGVESRWFLAPRHRPGTDAWRLDRRRARMAPERGWDVRRGDAAAFRDAPPAGP